MMMCLRFEVPAARAAMLIALVAGAGCGGSTSPDTPVPASITIQPTGASFDAIGGTVQLTATVIDQHGQLIANASPSWSSSNQAIASVSNTGMLTSVANGSAQITVAVGQVQAHVSAVVAQAPHTMIKVSGDQQSGTASQPLAAPLIVQVNDRLGHPVNGVSVSFTAAAGNGTITPASATTAGAGQAQAAWTLGAAAGAQHASVKVAQVDSAAFTATAQSGSAPTISTIAPDTLVEGGSATITGANFSSTPASNVVTVDGVAATVSTASAVSLTIVVPSYACKPVRLVTVTVQEGQLSATSAPKPLRPATMTALAVGEEAIVQDPTRFCLQFAAASGGADTYVVGLSAPAEVPGAVLPFVINTRGGAAVGALVTARKPNAAVSKLHLAAAGPLVASGGTGPLTLTRSLDRWRGQAQAEARLRQWERVHLPTLLAERGRLRAESKVRTLGGTVPAVGDTLTLRVPDLSAANLCTSYTTIRAVVRVIGSAGIWVQDVANPTTDSLTLADIQSASNQFDSKIYATDTTYFGSPSDIDGNGRVIVVLTWQVNRNRTPRILGFVFGGDLLSPASCPQSNGGELYYGQVPDPNNVAGTGARAKVDVVTEMPQLIAHEFTHIIQMSQRVILHNGSFMTSWEMEGQATFAEELVGDAVLGNTSGQNYGSSVAFGAAGINWYEDEIVKWDEYFGLLGANNQAANAPDLCTVYGSIQLTTLPCDVSAFYGASWILQRYIGDQYGPTYPGGLTQLTRDWVSKNVTASGTANISALLGVNYDSLFVRFATALALDDQSNSTGTAWVPQQFSITSWNSADLSSHLKSCCSFGWLSPPIMAFADASTSRSVRGGSTAYAVIGANGAHPAMAVQLTDPSALPLGTGLRPALWVVRIQ